MLGSANTSFSSLSFLGQLSSTGKSAHLPQKLQQWRTTGFDQPTAKYTISFDIKGIPEFRANFPIMENSTLWYSII